MDELLYFAHVLHSGNRRCNWRGPTNLHRILRRLQSGERDANSRMGNGGRPLRQYGIAEKASSSSWGFASSAALTARWSLPARYWSMPVEILCAYLILDADTDAVGEVFADTAFGHKLIS